MPVDIVFQTIFILLLLTLIYIMIKKRPKNYYTVFATVELIVALLLRITYGIVGFINPASASALMFNDRYQIPFYIVVKASSAMIFGWISVYLVLRVIRSDV